MPKVHILSAPEVSEVFEPVSRKQLTERALEPYREAMKQLDGDHPGGLVTLEEGETVREVALRVHRAAKERGLSIRFKRSRPNADELIFRLQTPGEIGRLKERGRALAEARREQLQANDELNQEVLVLPRKRSRRSG